MTWHPMSISSKRSGKAIEIWAIHRPREVCREGQGFPGPENTRQIKLGKLGTAPFFGLVREERRRLQEDWHFFFRFLALLLKVRIDRIVMVLLAFSLSGHGFSPVPPQRAATHRNALGPRCLCKWTRTRMAGSLGANMANTWKNYCIFGRFLEELNYYIYTTCILHSLHNYFM